MSDIDPTVALSSLSSSLSTLEESLAPLLSTPFAQLLAGPEGSEGVEPLLQARLEVLTGYVVHDLIWSEFALLLDTCFSKEDAFLCES